MTPQYVQAERPLSISTPLGANVLLLVGVRGHEGLSSLFRFEFDLLAENGAKLPFAGLLGQKVTATIRFGGGETRHISGLVSSFSQGTRDETFTSYRMEVVPHAWLLTRKHQSRIFQYLSVPDILKKVLSGLEVDYQIQGTFEAREYCAQYRESDLDFVSRLMEEEGIYYFFQHSQSGHTMVLANTPQSHADCDPSTAIYEEILGGNRPEERIYNWQKTQELRSGKTALWDDSFELPGKNLESTKISVDAVQVGTVSHKFLVGGNDTLELYDFPGGYANRFDGVARGGGDTSSELSKIFDDGKRTAEIRMQEDSAHGMNIHGASSCPQLTAGHRFELTQHFDGDGTYVLTWVEHRATLQGEYRSGGHADLNYENSFHCIPLALPYRPPRVTAIPRVYGAQTALVVGSAGEEIHTDKYGRIKVQFPWDREGKKDGDSSCWVRVATPWAGKQWGMIHIPRVGQEVVVEFVDGSVDNPIVVGSVYNAEQMPPYALPDNKTQSGIKSRSTLGGGASNYNEIRFEDKKGSEDLLVHAEKDQHIEVENDETHTVGHDRSKTVSHDETTVIKHDRTEKVLNDETIEITNNRAVTITQGNDSLKIKLGKSETEALQSIELKVGQSSIKLDPTQVTIKAPMITIEGQMQVEVSSIMTKVMGNGMLTLKGGLTMIN
jgi:type VI secretion system secreted protein VgrG